MKEVIDELCSDITLGKALRLRKVLKDYDIRCISKLAVFLMAYVICALAMFGVIVVCMYYSGEPMDADEMERIGGMLGVLGGGLIVGMMLAYQNLGDLVKGKVRKPIDDAVEGLSNEKWLP